MGGVQCGRVDKCMCAYICEIDGSTGDCILGGICVKKKVGKGVEVGGGGGVVTTICEFDGAAGNLGGYLWGRDMLAGI